MPVAAVVVAVVEPAEVAEVVATPSLAAALALVECS